MSACHNCGVQVNTDVDTCPECGATLHGQVRENPRSQSPPERSASTAPFPSTGIKLVSALSALSGVLLLLIGAANWVFASRLEQSDARNSAELANTAGDIAIAIVVVGVVGLVAAYGLWELQKWGWLVGLGYFSLHTLAGLVFALDGRTGMFAYAAVTAVLLGYVWQERDLYRTSKNRPGSGRRTGQY